MPLTIHLALLYNKVSLYWQYKLMIDELPYERNDKYDGSKSIYCTNCYKDGKFIEPDLTMEDMTEMIVPVLR